MEVTESRAPVNGVAFTTGESGDLTSGASLADTFDNFLTLLTTQLKNQDPLSPMDTNQFTEQLVSFTGVEQSLKTNKKLDELISLQSGNKISGALSYIGQEVTATSNAIMLDNGQAQVTYNLLSDSDQTTMVIVDALGNSVRSVSGKTEAGLHEFVWDGTDNDGNPVDDGVYGVVLTAVDTDENPVSLIQGTSGRVTGIRTDSDGNVILNLGDLDIPLDQVEAVKAIQPATSG